MILQTEVFKTNKKLIELIKNPLSDFMYLDVKSSKIFIEDPNMTISLPVNLQVEAGEENIESLVLSKSELLHLSFFEPELTIKKNGNYSGANLKGKLLTSNQVALDYLPVQFEDFEGESFVSWNSDNLKTLVKAKNFTNKEDEKISCQCVHIKDSLIASSSLGRTYVCTTNFGEKEGVLNSLTISAILLLGEGCEMLSNNNSFLLQNRGIQVMTPKLKNADILPLADFLQRIEQVREANALRLNVKSLLTACSALDFYASKNVNNKTNFKLEDDSLILNIDENSFCIEHDKYNIQSENIDFNLNLNFLKLAISSLCGEDILDVIMYEDPSFKVYLIEIKDGELITLGKLVK